jgi:predicted metal-binding membrane protein
LKTKTRALIFIVTLVILSGILAFASTITLSASDANSLSQSVQGINGTTTNIFQNNVQIALLEFVPVFGPGFGAYSSFDTGLAIAALAQTNSNSGLNGLELFIFLLFTPIYWFEFACYSLAVEESISLLVSFKNRDFRRSEWRWLLGSILFVVATLFVSAGIEANMINIVK